MSDQLQGETQQRDGPRGDAESLVKKWITTLQDESRVTDEDAEDLTLRIIAFAAATSSPAHADAHQVRCVHGVPEGLTCAICGPIRNDDPPTLAPAESTRVEGEQEAYCANCRSHHLLPLCTEPEHFVKKIVARSDSARRAAEEVADYVSDGIMGMGNEVTERNAAKFLEIISKYLPPAAAPADNDAETKGESDA